MIDGLPPLLDMHGHPPSTPGSQRTPEWEGRLIEALERYNSRLMLADLASDDESWVHEPSVEHWQQGNSLCADTVQRHPERFAAYCYVNPAQTREALGEMERRLLGERDTFVALKLWVAVRCGDARLDPLMEFCAAYDVPVLQHTWMKVGVSGPGGDNLPGESTPDDLLALARRHPRVKFFGGHSGGDWEWGVAALKQADNIWLDVAGGEATGGYAELALREVGASRIVYGTDMMGRSLPSQLAKLIALDLPPDDLERVLWGNTAHILGDRLPSAWRGVFA